MMFNTKIKGGIESGGDTVLSVADVEAVKVKEVKGGK
jgi:hypothetical protein